VRLAASLLVIAAVGGAARADPWPWPLLPAPSEARQGDRLVRLPFAWGTPRARHLSAELPEAGRSARGIFLSPFTLRRRGAAEVAAGLRGARLTALVTDVKDERGRIVIPADEPSLAGQLDVQLPDVRTMLAALHAAGIWVVGRIVCFKDQALAEARPDLAPIDRTSGRPWRGHLGVRWVSPYATEVQDRIVAVARQAERLGFDEVQLDYVRFPVEDEAATAEWPGRSVTLRRFVIARLLERLDDALHIPISVDLFGLTPFNEGDPTGLGQSLEDMAPHVQLVTPMLYSSSFDESTVATPAFGHRVGTIVGLAVDAVRRRVGHQVAVRPFLQAFPRSEPEFGLSYIQAQLAAARARGADGFLFWNPRSEYGTVFEAFRQLGQP
jgi:hypothetical protein